jgi:hypothetical protein
MTNEKEQKALDAFDELGALNPDLAYNTAMTYLERQKQGKKISDMSPEEAMADIRRRSPAVAFAQDAGFLPGGPPHDDPSLPFDTLHSPEDVVAAIKTNRWQLLAPARARAEDGEPLPPKSLIELHQILGHFYQDNVREPVLSELLEALAPTGDQTKAEASIVVLDALKVILQAVDHRQESYSKGEVPSSDIPDGASRTIAF